MTRVNASKPAERVEPHRRRQLEFVAHDETEFLGDAPGGVLHAEDHLVGGLVAARARQYSGGRIQDYTTWQPFRREPHRPRSADRQPEYDRRTGAHAKETRIVELRRDVGKRRRHAHHEYGQ